MKRKEEIRKEAEDSTFALEGDIGTAPHSREVITDYFIEMAEWADKTMLDKVCEFIKKRFTETIVGNVISKRETTINEVINDLRKAMMED